MDFSQKFLVLVDQIHFPPQDEVGAWLLLNGESHPKENFTALPTPPAHLFLLYLFLYCNKVVKGLIPSLSDTQHVQNFLQSVAMCCLTAFGGSFINPALLAQKAPPLDNEKFVLCMVFSWWLYHNSFFGRLTRWIANTFLADLIISAGYEIFRSWVIFAWYTKARNSLSEESAFYFAPIVCGTIGGSGGLFLPWNKGLSPLSDGIPWNLESAFFAAGSFHVYDRFVSPTAEQLLFAKVVITCTLLLARIMPFTVSVFMPLIRVVLRALLGLTPPSETTRSVPEQPKPEIQPQAGKDSITTKFEKSQVQTGQRKKKNKKKQN